MYLKEANMLAVCNGPLPAQLWKKGDTLVGVKMVWPHSSTARELLEEGSPSLALSGMELEPLESELCVELPESRCGTSRARGLETKVPAGDGGNPVRKIVSRMCRDRH